MPSVQCPHCGFEQFVSRDLIGLTADCEQCHEPFAVGERGAAPARPAKRKQKLPLSFYISVTCLILSAVAIWFVLHKIRELNAIKAEIEQIQKNQAAEKPEPKVQFRPRQ